MTKKPPVDIETISSRVVYENRWMRLREDGIRRRDGSESIYGVVEKPNFVAIVALHDDRRLQLVQQFRYPVGGRHWELPQGAWEGRADVGGGATGLGTALDAAARRELREETGLRAARMVDAGELFLAYGFSNQRYHVFLATGLTQGETSREVEEQDMISQAFALIEVERMIRDGDIRDATTVAALGLLRLKNLL